MGDRTSPGEAGGEGMAKSLEDFLSCDPHLVNCVSLMHTVPPDGLPWLG